MENAHMCERAMIIITIFFTIKEICTEKSLRKIFNPEGVVYNALQIITRFILQINVLMNVCTVHHKNILLMNNFLDF